MNNWRVYNTIQDNKAFMVITNGDKIDYPMLIANCIVFDYPERLPKHAKQLAYRAIKAQRRTK